jgi:hypothetical protein
VSAGGNFSATQRYRLHATNVSARKTTKLVVRKTATKTFPHMLVKFRTGTQRVFFIALSLWERVG